jgi:hypothetical protein
LKAAWRTMPSPVQPAKPISATSCGLTQWMPRALAGALAPPNGLLPAVSALMRGKMRATVLLP